jgi:hypothetical protein
MQPSQSSPIADYLISNGIQPDHFLAYMKVFARYQRLRLRKVPKDTFAYHFHNIHRAQAELLILNLPT